MSDPDADKLLKLFEYILSRGKHVAVMAHFSHPRELATQTVQNAIYRIKSIGAVIRSQSPVVRHINDSADIWVKLWENQIKLEIIPYYMFLESTLGLGNYYKVTFEKALKIFREAQSSITGLARTVCGPVANSSRMKLQLEDIVDISGKKQFAFKCIQAKEPFSVGKLFFALYKENVPHIDQVDFL